MKHGSGIWRGNKGDSYLGEWKFGKADGYGVHTWVNGDRYEGQFKQCLKVQIDILFLAWRGSRKVLKWGCLCRKLCEWKA